MDGDDRSSTLSATAGRKVAVAPHHSAPPAPEPGDLIAANAEIGRLRVALAEVEARERLLVDELHHRVRNMLATIRSIVRQTWEEGASQEEYAQHIQGRLDAIARYQTRVAGVGIGGFDVEDMIRDELLQTGCLDTSRCSIDGPVVRLHGREAELFGLALHELTTNAIKFGAFAGGGKLAVAWSVTGARLDFRWEETGVAVASPAPRPSGFGRGLIETGLAYELGAATMFELRPGGLVCAIALPLSSAPAGGTETSRVARGDESEQVQ